MKVTERLHIFVWHDQRENNCNSVFIDGKVPLLIDPGHLHKVNMLFDRMAEDGVDAGRIKAVICTHGHPDHFEGTLAFARSSAKIGLSQKEEKYIEEIGRPMYAQLGTTMPDFSVDFHLKEGDLIVGRHELQVLATPGHSPGSISIYWPRHRMLVAGDVIFQHGIGRVDLPGGDSDTLKKTIERLSMLPVDLLVPGHGPVIQGADRVRSNFDWAQRTFLNLL